jgi:hypothetical protein
VTSYAHRTYVYLVPRLENKKLYLNREQAGGQHYLRALRVNRSWVFMRSKDALSRRPSLQFERRELKVATAWLELS